MGKTWKDKKKWEDKQKIKKNKEKEKNSKSKIKIRDDRLISFNELFKNIIALLLYSITFVRF